MANKNEQVGVVDGSNSASKDGDVNVGDSINSRIKEDDVAKDEQEPQITSDSSDVKSDVKTTSATEQADKSNEADNISLSNEGGGDGFIAWLGLIAAILVGVYFWKKVNSLNAQLSLLQSKFNKVDKDFKELNERSEVLSEKIANLNNRKDDFSDRRQAEIQAAKISHTKPVRRVDDQKTTRAVEMKYANPQAPDSLGVVRFSERSMVETPSLQKFFILELDNLSGRGTYQINQSALSEILQDLQMIKEFVKPFTLSPNAVYSSIEDVKKGTIVKKGSSWEVENLLEIKIH